MNICFEWKIFFLKKWIILTFSILFLNYLPNFEFLNSARFHKIKTNLVRTCHCSSLRIPFGWEETEVAKTVLMQKSFHQRSQAQEMTRPLPPIFWKVRRWRALMNIFENCNNSTGKVTQSNFEAKMSLIPRSYACCTFKRPRLCK